MRKNPTPGPWQYHVANGHPSGRPHLVIHGYTGNGSKHDNPWIADLDRDNHSDADLICLAPRFYSLMVEMVEEFDKGGYEPVSFRRDTAVSKYMGKIRTLLKSMSPDSR